MVLPIEYTHLGYSFLDKVEGFDLFHPGVDLNKGPNPESDLGMPVHAMADGVVSHAQRYNGPGWGNLLIIEHAELGIWSRYAHLQQINVQKGDEVKEGDVIATVGDTGVTSPHLHFEIYKKALPSFTFYPHGWSQEKVQEYWVDPVEYIAQGEPGNGETDEPKNVPKDASLAEGTFNAPPSFKPPSDWAQEAWDKAINKGIYTDHSNPHKNLSYQEFAVIMDRLGFLE